MEYRRHHPTPEAASCSGSMEEVLNGYMDGELPFEAQPALFAHLATCSRCRGAMAALIEFRRMSRQETLAVPAAVDDAFFQRLDQVKHRTARLDRSAQRRPLWQTRAPVSLRTATTAALVLFVAGLLFPQHAGEPPPAAQVEGHEERVEFPAAVRVPGEAVYVFYPGLIIEATKIDEQAGAEPL